MMYQNSMQCMQPSTQNNSVMTSMNMNNMMNSNMIPTQQPNMMMQQPNMMMQPPNMMQQQMMMQQ